MARYIDADKLIERICKGCHYENECGDACEEYRKVRTAPTEDVHPVVHAKWGERYFGGDGYLHLCSNCGYDSEKTNYCAKCGAKMDLK